MNAPGRSLYFTLVDKTLASAEDKLAWLSTQREAKADVSGSAKSSAAYIRLAVNMLKTRSYPRIGTQKQRCSFTSRLIIEKTLAAHRSTASSEEATKSNERIRASMRFPERPDPGPPAPAHSASFIHSARFCAIRSFTFKLLSNEEEVSSFIATDGVENGVNALC